MRLYVIKGAGIIILMGLLLAIPFRRLGLLIAGLGIIALTMGVILPRPRIVQKIVRKARRRKIRRI
ncbi:hypothetical protein J4436_01050 [Candidatus Woesearchaeota archaeon]|nr:hypothetical protein [Candidatus Woesearchaeota archaeon]